MEQKNNQEQYQHRQALKATIWFMVFIFVMAFLGGLGEYFFPAASVIN